MCDVAFCIRPPPLLSSIVTKSVKFLNDPHYYYHREKIYSDILWNFTLKGDNKDIILFSFKICNFTYLIMLKCDLLDSSPEGAGAAALNAINDAKKKVIKIFIFQLFVYSSESKFITEGYNWQSSFIKYPQYFHLQ